MLRKFVILIAVSAALAACGDDEKPSTTSNATTPDGGSTTNNLSTDAGTDPDSGTDDDAGDTDAGMASCTLPTPIVAGTEQTDALANDPARCGAPAYQWSRDESLGDIVEFGTSNTFQAALINAVAASENVVLPRAAEYDVQVEQFAYKTQDRGDLIDATGLVAFPTNLETDEPVQIVLLLHGTAGFTDECAPSAEQDSRALAAILATFGYIVVAPDYIGLKALGDPTGFKHPYLVGEATAIASLDAVRAVYKLPADKRGGLCPSTEFGYFGGSQGGHAALWVDRLAPYYARELTMLGGVATVPPADVLGQMDRALQAPVQATGNTVAFLGASADWYGQEGNLSDVFVSPLDVEIPAALGSSCDPESQVTIDPENLSDVFTTELLDAAQNGMLEDFGFAGCMTTENTIELTSVERIPSDLPSYGILNIFGENDSLVHTPIEREAFTRLCNAGMPYEYLECAGAGHVDATFWAISEIVTFLEARLNKEPFEPSCTPPAATMCSGTQ